MESTSFLNLPGDLRRKIALDLDGKDLINLCLTSKEEFYKTICNDSDFWRLKLFRDYPEIKKYYEKTGVIFRNPKTTYLRVFSQIAELIEKVVDGAVEKETVTNHLDLDGPSSPNNPNNPEMKKQLFNFLYKTFNDIRKEYPYKFEEYKPRVNYFIDKNKNLLNLEVFKRYKDNMAARIDLEIILSENPLRRQYLANFIY